MIFLIFFLLSIASLIMQTTVFPLLPKWMGSPDLLFVTTIYTMTHLETPHGLAFMFLNGLLLDVFAGTYLGIYPIAFLLLFAVVKLITKQIVINDTLHQTPFIVISYLFASGNVYFLTKLLSPEQSHQWVWRDILLETFIVTLLAIPLHTFFKGIVNKLQAKKSKGYFKRVKKSNYFQ